MGGLSCRRASVATPRTRLAPLAPVALVLLAALLAAGCSSRPSGAFRHEVRRGENLYRIGQRYGVPAEVLREINDIDDVHGLQVGQEIWIPPAGQRRARVAPGKLEQRVPSAARSPSGNAFRWPVNGKLTSRFGPRRGGSHEGIDIGAPRGTRVSAAEAGKVVFAGRMGDYGRLVIVKHSGNVRTVYAHLHRMHVAKGAFVERGQPIGEVGTSGNASGPHLHFEVREQDRPRDPIRYLP